MKVKAIIFDLFGTLIDSFNSQKYRQILSEMASSLSLPEDSFYDLWNNSFNQRALGTFKTLEESFEFISNQLKIPLDPEGIAQAIKIRFDYSKKTLVPRADTLSTLKQLRSKGFKIGLISDCTYEIPSIWDRTKLAKHFDSVIFSCIYGIKKPDPKIYLLACKKLKVKPKNCIYVGDGSSRELTGALQVGMFPILIRSPSEIDSVRFEEESWDGPKISSLSEVLNFIDP
jgi:putative hydrolase of the HAD superfamily